MSAPYTRGRTAKAACMCTVKSGTHAAPPRWRQVIRLKSRRATALPSPCAPHRQAPPLPPRHPRTQHTHRLKLARWLAIEPEFRASVHSIIPAPTRRFVMNLIPYAVILVFLIAIVLAMVRVMREYERGVVFTLGRFSGVKGPGLI